MSLINLHCAFLLRNSYRKNILILAYLFFLIFLSYQFFWTAKFNPHLSDAHRLDNARLRQDNPKNHPNRSLKGMKCSINNWSISNMLHLKLTEMSRKIVRGHRYSKSLHAKRMLKEAFWILKTLNEQNLAYLNLHQSSRVKSKHRMRK